MHATEIEVVAALERDVRLAKVRVLEQLGIDQSRHRRAQPRPDEVAKKLAGTKALFLVTTHVHPEHDLGAQAFPDTTTLIRSIDQVNEIAKSGLQLAKVFASRPPINSLKNATILLE